MNKIAKSLKCSTRTVYRTMGNQLKQEKDQLNKMLWKNIIYQIILSIKKI